MNKTKGTQGRQREAKRADRFPCYAESPRQRVKRLRRQWERKSVRFAPTVLRRDKYTCRCCKFSPQTISKDQWGAVYPDLRYPKLTVDHLVPLLRGGQSVLKNLIVLCDYCNYAKWDKNLTPTSPLPSKMAEQQDRINFIIAELRGRG